MKVTVVGSGFVGQTTAMRILEKSLGEVVLIDIIEGKPQGLALDLKQAAPVEGYEPLITGTNDYADTAGSDIVVITAGFPRQPGMSRMDLLGKNAAIMTSVVDAVVPGSPNAIIIVVSNPLDEMTFLAAERSGFPKERVFGMAGVLDSARLRYFISELTGVSPTKIDAMTLGSHGDAMIALPRHATVDGKPLPELVDEATLESLFQRTRDGGAEIVGLLKTGSAYYAPSASVVAMVEAIATDSKAVLPVCAWATGQYGIDDVYVGVPARLGAKGVEEIVELDLNEDELTALRGAAEGIRVEVRGPGEAVRLRLRSDRGDGALVVVVQTHGVGERQRAPDEPEEPAREREPDAGAERRLDHVLELLSDGFARQGALTRACGRSHQIVDELALEAGAGRQRSSRRPIPRPRSPRRSSARPPPSVRDVPGRGRPCVPTSRTTAHPSATKPLGEVDPFVDLVEDGGVRVVEPERHPGEERAQPDREPAEHGAEERGAPQAVRSRRRSGCRRRARLVPSGRVVDGFVAHAAESRIPCIALQARSGRRRVATMDPWVTEARSGISSASTCAHSSRTGRSTRRASGPRSASR